MMHASLKEHNMILFQVLCICEFPGCMHLCFNGLSLFPFTVDLVYGENFIYKIFGGLLVLFDPFTAQWGNLVVFVEQTSCFFLLFWTINEMLTFLF